MRGQWVKVLDTKSDDLSLIPRTHTVEDENRIPCEAEFQLLLRARSRSSELGI